MSSGEEFKRLSYWVAIFIGIAGLLAAFYFYFFPHNNRGLAYSASDPLKIFDSANASPALHLVDSSNLPIKSDTYLQVFTIWNYGTAAIEPTDVRKPVSLVFNGAERILDYKIITATDQDVCEFSLVPNLQTNVIAPNIQLFWKHFDPKKAVKFQVVFCQTSKPAGTIDASHILGIKELKHGIERSENKKSNWVSPFVLVLVGLSNLWLGISTFRDITKKQMPVKTGFVLGAIQIISALFLFWLFITRVLQPTAPI